jgi:hypothetical protein
MQYAIHRISLDINDDSPSQLTISARQGDIANLLIISLLADKQNYVIEKDSYATLTGKRENGTAFEHNCVVNRETNKIEYTFNTNTVSTKGRIDCEINIYTHLGERLTTARFNIVVYSTIFFDNIEDEEEDITSVTQLRGDLQTLITQVVHDRDNGNYNGKSIFIKYSEYADGTDYTEKWSVGQNYVGIAIAKVEPKDKYGYEWRKKGADIRVVTSDELLSLKDQGLVEKDVVYALEDDDTLEVLVSSIEENKTAIDGHTVAIEENKEDINKIKDGTTPAMNANRILINDRYYPIVTTTDLASEGTEGTITFVLED